MTQIKNVPEILEVKEILEKKKQEALLVSWELPYENILTRLSAAVFFLSPVSDEALQAICCDLAAYGNFKCEKNQGTDLSDLQYSITFEVMERKESVPIT